MLLKEVQRNCLLHNKAFVSFRLPGEELVSTFAGGSFSLHEPENTKPYFVLAPFDSRRNTTLYFCPEFQFVGNEIPEVDLSASASPIAAEAPQSVTQQDYLVLAGRLIGQMQQQQYRKLVLSRVVKRELGLKQLPEYFKRLCSLYPKAFVFLLSDGHQTCWTGATPELLLDYRDGKAKTVALAATQKLNGRLPEELVWGAKEAEEQDLVTEFIRRMLASHRAMQLELEGPAAVAAGNLAHLKTTFAWQSSFEEAKAIAANLHPTPAVCGLPRHETMMVIGQSEKHDRSYYTGYLGFVKPNEEIKLFVNLRCMQWLDGMGYLYVGGGLTALSKPLDEWNETQAKAETLLAAFPK